MRLVIRGSPVSRMQLKVHIRWPEMQMCTTYGHTLHTVFWLLRTSFPELGFILKRYFSAAAFYIMVHYDSVMRKYLSSAKRAPAGAARRGGGGELQQALCCAGGSEL